MTDHFRRDLARDLAAADRVEAYILRVARLPKNAPLPTTTDPAVMRMLATAGMHAPASPLSVSVRIP